MCVCACVIESASVQHPDVPVRCVLDICSLLKVIQGWNGGMLVARACGTLHDLCGHGWVHASPSKAIHSWCDHCDHCPSSVRHGAHEGWCMRRPLATEGCGSIQIAYALYIDNSVHHGLSHKYEPVHTRSVHCRTHWTTSCGRTGPRATGNLRRPSGKRRRRLSCGTRR